MCTRLTTCSSRSIPDTSNGIANLERRLDPADFLRIHRGTLVNVRFIAEAHAGFAGGMALRLKDAKRTSLQVARDRVREVKGRLGF